MIGSGSLGPGSNGLHVIYRSVHVVLNHRGEALLDRFRSETEARGPARSGGILFPHG